MLAYALGHHWAEHPVTETKYAHVYCLCLAKLSGFPLWSVVRRRGLYGSVHLSYIIHLP